MIISVFGCSDKECNEQNSGPAMLDTINEFLDANEQDCEKLITHANTEFCTVFIEEASKRGIETVSMVPFEMRNEAYCSNLISFTQRAGAVASSVVLINPTFSHMNVLKMHKQMKEEADHWVVLCPEDGCCVYTCSIMEQSKSLEGKTCTNMWKTVQVD